MKNIPVLLLFCLLSVVGQAQSNDELAIRKVIHDETDAFIKLNYEKEIGYFVHQPYTTQQYNNADGSASINEGWDNISNGLKAYFKANPKQNFVNVERSKWQIQRMSPDWCWVRFDQIMTDINGKAGKSTENRIMQRVNGKWKIASIIALWDFRK